MRGAARQAAAGLSQFGRPTRAGQVPDLGLGQADLLQRAADAPLAGHLTRRVVAQIIGVGAVHQAGIAVRQRVGQQLIQVVAFAEIAAVRGVGPVGRIVQLRRVGRMTCSTPRPAATGEPLRVPPRGTLGESAVSANARSPSASRATARTNAVSVPPNRLRRPIPSRTGSRAAGISLSCIMDLIRRQKRLVAAL